MLIFIKFYFIAKFYDGQREYAPYAHMTTQYVFQGPLSNTFRPKCPGLLDWFIQSIWVFKTPIEGYNKNFTNYLQTKYNTNKLLPLHDEDHAVGAVYSRCTNIQDHRARACPICSQSQKYQ